MNEINFEKSNGLVPAVIQDNTTLQVLMVGFMNREAYEKTLQEGKVTFFSRTRNKLWTKGETSGNFLIVKEITTDCDNDTILIRAEPEGPVCHTGSYSCFGDQKAQGFLHRLEKIIEGRIADKAEGSYTWRIFSEGISRAAQKVGEEAVEVVIEAMGSRKELFTSETADLLYHLLILMKTKGVTLNEIEEELMKRHKN
ncbi:MAG TPA: bifunctional phosphoribosyl-AMP cyclohydrolase/phosphoribosyl-ATP diphosphatase HisIE [Bacteroidales bacterium]|nr:bifunctional phosphoribosyl-AMP cyclohydrolase/phosphoribosyl-ATP diphosphatase HisIE [Bacteroidales bacterium]HPJ59674.1 bifunctional phosphoribosyl-AMP cyclohydrolase/phosphoribosyl-ATP diphosphatase HisIE [Bacteroidales bacterium]HPR12510.1 bifunctional phosphoribosyl-AMP cyclohydrolase/phosphoribosyl-ATP diphosphatase HisIE [Bacteroidales bacterium]HRW84909.1 bifunctional phosphoribosyl-AMP cyclohydrolase/phosphoribosyl-ATP diphosphatase HisIE [Bacteroidales bacterium]